MKFENPIIFYTAIYEGECDLCSKADVHYIIFNFNNNKSESHIFFDREYKKYYNFINKNNLNIFDEYEIEISNGVFEILVSGIKNENFNFNVVNNISSKISSFIFQNDEQIINVIVDEINKWFILNPLKTKYNCLVYPKELFEVFLKGLQIKEYKKMKLEEC